jgi:hypothetical protein
MSIKEYHYWCQYTDGQQSEIGNREPLHIYVKQPVTPATIFSEGESYSILTIFLMRCTAATWRSAQSKESEFTHTLVDAPFIRSTYFLRTFKNLYFFKAVSLL